MQNKRAYFYLLQMAFLGYWLLSEAGIPLAAQTSEGETERQKNFGATLKQFEQQSNDKSGNKPRIAEKSEDGDIIQIDTVMVISDILVFDKKGEQVRNLKKEDFIVKEDGQIQQIEAFSPGDNALLPRSIILIIDYSGSQLPYLKTSVDAAKILVDKLNSYDRMAVVTDDVELVQDFTADKKLLKEKLDLLKTKAFSKKTGRSMQYSALMAALGEMFDTQTLRPVIIFQTDGDEFIRLKGNAAHSIFKGLEDVSFGFRDILTAAEKARTTIYTVIPGQNFIDCSENERIKRAKTELMFIEKVHAEINNTEFNEKKLKVRNRFLEARAAFYFRQQSALAEIAKFTGGWTRFLETPEQAESVYADILAEMNRRYIIGYYPTNQDVDGKRRKVSIEIRGRSDYEIWGRKSYILEKNR